MIFTMHSSTIYMLIKSIKFQPGGDKTTHRSQSDSTGYFKLLERKYLKKSIILPSIDYSVSSVFLMPK